MNESLGVLKVNKRQLQFFLRARGARVIYADSMPRSGSTAIFNALRLLLLTDPDCDLQSGWVRDARNMPPANTYLIKTHGMNLIDSWRASKTVYSYRDPRVALVSLSRKFGSTPSMRLVRMWMADFAFAEKHADLLLRYDMAMRDLRGTVCTLADLVGVEADCQQIADRLSPSPGGGDGPDKLTLLHGEHATGTTEDEWRTALPSDLNAQIVDEFGPWLERYGYPLF